MVICVRFIFPFLNPDSGTNKGGDKRHLNLNIYISKVFVEVGKKHKS